MQALILDTSDWYTSNFASSYVSAMSCRKVIGQLSLFTEYSTSACFQTVHTSPSLEFQVQDFLRGPTVLSPCHLLSSFRTNVQDVGLQLRVHTLATVGKLK